ncbi:MAG: hypothetical protein H6R21_3057 [Proteobacteria bacterium]|nr:hypothetical protein [Pseudomonadota bacterium]
MNTRTYKRMHLRLLLAGIAGILVSGIAIASIAISARGSSGAFTPDEPQVALVAPHIAPPGTRGYRCKECGVIESARKIEIPDELIQMHAPGRFAAGGGIDGTPGRYAITIRLQDGTTRAITDAHPANWRVGERVSLIGGME